jgi:hypothetical protein
MAFVNLAGTAFIPYTSDGVRLFLTEFRKGLAQALAPSARAIPSPTRKPIVKRIQV